MEKIQLKLSFVDGTNKSLEENELSYLLSVF